MVTGMRRREGASRRCRTHHAAGAGSSPGRGHCRDRYGLCGPTAAEAAVTADDHAVTLVVADAAVKVAAPAPAMPLVEAAPTSMAEAEVADGVAQ